MKCKSDELFLNMKLLRGDEVADPEALEQMRASPANLEGTRWACYQNQDLGHRHCGHLRFLAVGPQNTLHTAPEKHPDLPKLLLWRYVLVGFVDLKTGVVTPD